MGTEAIFQVGQLTASPTDSAQRRFPLVWSPDYDARMGPPGCNF
jgi:hypothetical protein